MVSPFPRTASARRGTGGRWWMRPPRGATARCSVRATLARHPKFCVQRRLHLTQRAPQLGLVALVEQLGSHQLVVAVLGTVERRGRHAAAAERWRDGRSPWGRWRTRRKNTRGPRLQVLHMYKAHSDSYVCSLVPGTATFQQSQFTPGGLIYKSGGSNMQYVTTATFLLLAYAKYLRTGGAAVSCAGCDVHPAELVALAKRQVDYILGKNPRGVSYMVGFGPRFPRRLHHRGASMPALRDHPGRIGCDEGFRYLHSGEDDRYVLVGAVVGGPDARDAFADDRDSYGQSEPATYVNAPLVRALAFFAGN